MLKRIADVMGGHLDEMGRKDFLLYFLGCCNGELLEVDPRAFRERQTRVGACLEYIREEQDSFKRDEVEKIVYLLRHSEKYRVLLDELPASWKEAKERLLDYINARGT